MTGSHNIWTTKFGQAGIAETDSTSQAARIVLRTPMLMTKALTRRMLGKLGLRIKKVNTTSLPTQKEVTTGLKRKMAKRVCVRLSGSYQSNQKEDPSPVGKQADDNIL